MPDFPNEDASEFNKIERDKSTLEALGTSVSEGNDITMLWEPKEDITTYELARAIPMFVALRPDKVFPGLPLNVRRHWRGIVK